MPSSCIPKIFLGCFLLTLLTSRTSADLVLNPGDVLTQPGEIHQNIVNNGLIVGYERGLEIMSPFVVSGSGSIENTLIMGTYSPGNSPAIIRGKNLGFGGVVVIELGGNTPGFGDGNHDQINVSGNLTIRPTATLSIQQLGEFIPSVGDRFEVFNWESRLDGVFLNVLIDPSFASQGIGFETVYDNVNSAGNLTLVTTAVPEPSTLIFGCLISVCFLVKYYLVSQRDRS